MSHTVFISYRRADTAGHAGRISDDLQRRFGSGSVFRDIGSIEAGNNFIAALDAALTAARAVLVLIGDTWLTELDDRGERRLDDPQDFVHREIATALLRDDVFVLPVLVEGARMPQPAELPEALRGLTRLQAIELTEQRWQYDLERLAKVLADAGVPDEQSRCRKVWHRCVAVLAFALFVGLGAWYLQSTGPAVEDYTGLWRLPNDSYWTVRADQDLLIVEETHHQSKQIWQRGEGQLGNGMLTVELQLVFEKKPYRYRYRLTLSRDGRHMVGTVIELASGEKKSVVLTRG